MSGHGIIATMGYKCVTLMFGEYRELHCIYEDAMTLKMFCNIMSILTQLY